MYTLAEKGRKKDLGLVQKFQIIMLVAESACI